MSGSKTTRAQWLSRGTRFLWVGCSVLLAFFLISALALAIFHLRYPFELEWLEGGILDHVARVVRGEPLYVRPSFAFTPFVYGPLYFYITAFLARIVGLGFFALRLVSVGALFGTFFLLYRITYQETKEKRWSLLAPALFASCYAVSGAWFDLARVDALMLFLLALSVYLLRKPFTWKTILLASVCAVLAFFTKQLVWAFYLPIVVVLALQVKRYAALFVASGLILTLPIYLGLNQMSQGWLHYYVVTLPARHAIESVMIGAFWYRDVFAVFGVGTFLALSYFLTPLRQSTRNATRLFYGAVVVGGLTMGWLGRMHSGGYLNVLLPTYLCLSLVAAFALIQWRTFFRERVHVRFAFIMPLALFIQLSLLVYNPYVFLPPRSIRAAQAQFAHDLQTFPKPVFIVNHGGYFAHDPSSTFAHAMALTDIARSNDPEMQARITQEFRRLLQQQYFGTIILDDTYTWKQDEIELYYERVATLPGEESFEITDVPMRPRFIYAPRPWPNKNPPTSL